MHEFTQVVEHNQVQDISEHIFDNGEFIFCDCLANKKYLKLG
jgi:hypothetical protein